MMEVDLCIDVCLLREIKEIEYQRKQILILLYNVIESLKVDL